MSKEQDKKVLQRIEETIEKIKIKDFNIFFFVFDSKNSPNGNLSYIYQMAKTLQDKEYNVKMLYQLENEYTPQEIEEIEKKGLAIDENRTFNNVSSWMGEEYLTLEHINIQREEWKVSPCDVLFIPEVFSGLMFETFKHNIPCKRYIILQNFDYITEFIPLGVEWLNYGIKDVITTTKTQETMVKEIFPYVKTTVVPPFIDNIFRKPIKPKKLIVNIVTKNQSTVNKIIKNFYWKYPTYRFVSFRDLRGFPRKDFAELLKEGAITIWVDENTYFGYTPLEAMRCGNIVIGKIPENEPDWMVENDKLKNNGIWFDNFRQLPDILSRVIHSWMNDEIPQILTDKMEETNTLFSFNEWDKNINTLIENITTQRIDELNNILKSIKK